MKNEKKPFKRLEDVEHSGEKTAIPCVVHLRRVCLCIGMHSGQNRI